MKTCAFHARLQTFQTRFRTIRCLMSKRFIARLLGSDMPLETVQTVFVENAVFDASATQSETGASDVAKTIPAPYRSSLAATTNDTVPGTGFQSFVAGAPVNSARSRTRRLLFLSPSLRRSGSVFPLYIGHRSSITFSVHARRPRSTCFVILYVVRPRDLRIALCRPP